MSGNFVKLGMGILVLASAAVAVGQMQPACLETTGVREVVAEHPELTGERVRVGLVELCQTDLADEADYSFLPNLEHRGLLDSNLSEFYYYENPYLPVCYSAHASMIMGILFGDDATGGFGEMGTFEYRGMAPAAAVSIYETNWFIYKRVIAPDAPAMDVDVMNISWGTDANDVVTMWWQRGIDAMVGRDECVVVAGCGNGTSEFDGISKPSWGYNVISVGTGRSVGSWPDNLSLIGPPVPQESSFGPTSDGRAKPDIIAPGLSLGPCADSDREYCHPATVGCSSFASAQVTGAAALLIDAARYEQIEDGDDPRVIKALLLNGADKLNGWHQGRRGDQDDHEAPLDYSQGAGLLNLASAYRQLRGQRDPNGMVAGSGWWRDSVGLSGEEEGRNKVHEVAGPVAQGDSVKATLVWYRHYRRGLGRELSRLELELWSVDAEGQLAERLDYSASRIDNVQHIYYQVDQPGQVVLVVRGVEGESAGETYALAYTSEQENWSGDQLAADFNADGTVDAHDLTQWVRVWMFARSEAEGEHLPEDLNSDGRVDEADFDLLSSQWRQRSSWYRGPVGEW